VNIRPLFASEGKGHRVWMGDYLAKRAVGFASPRGINIFAAVIIGFALLILVGFLLLMLPRASATGEVTLFSWPAYKAGLGSGG
jgi:hypothetical protein